MIAFSVQVCSHGAEMLCIFRSIYASKSAAANCRCGFYSRVFQCHSMCTRRILTLIQCWNAHQNPLINQCPIDFYRKSVPVNYRMDFSATDLKSAM